MYNFAFYLSELWQKKLQPFFVSDWLIIFSRCEEQDKFTLVYALMKLHLLRGKSIIFVNEVNRCYK